MAGKSRESWKKALIDETKKEIKIELDQVLRESGETERLNYILEQIQLLDLSKDSVSMLRRFIFIMSALVHHERFGGLGKKQIHDLSNLGEAILRVAGVKPGHSPISFLFSEMHSIMSDIHLGNGEFLPSLWERLLSAHLSAMPAEHMARQNLGIGINALRLGNTALAIEFFQKGLRETEESKTLDRLRLYLIKSTRLSGDIIKADQLVQQYAPQLTDPACVHELHWEKTCISASQSLDLGELFKLSMEGGTHYTNTYPLELFFWAYAHPKTSWSKRLEKLSKLTHGLDVQRNSGFHALAQSLEQAYDTDIPFAKRLSDIKRVITKIEVLRNIDQRLLVWLALARWLHRSNHRQIAAIVLYEYMSLSQKLSFGKHLDVLRLAEDLVHVYSPEGDGSVNPMSHDSSND
ncbi:MAG TPA: hypothetical protein VE954_35975 [Oligoflexus sp.]|uniref:hypothetical protein n=1 Tax=Oligoflexus sp. TaxID=1971216 RepID=UPI002D58C2DB|nr:hypothetical protein [Oligoflexus sp.]HYX38532.1 hypothetical protein [Oligoflexus sp.]